MIRSAENYPISQLFDIESNVVYCIPRYQREYIWGKWEWEKFFDDILENDNGYFLGSIICINQSKDTLSTQELELVDGQQRMTTLSLLFAAIYSHMKTNNSSFDEDELNEVINLKRKIILKKDYEIIRVTPQVQNNNQQDYFAVLGKAGIIKTYETPSNAGNRRIFKAYRYFQERIKSLSEEQEEASLAVKQFLEKVNQSTIVKIEVASHSDAYTLFESLNNRGVPLTAIDLIKTKLLAELEKKEPGKIDNYFEKWNYLLNYLGDDYTVQERFFRQYYNAFKPNLVDISNFPVATRSNLIKIYEKLILNDANGFLERILEAGKWYSFILGRIDDEEHTSIKESLKHLERIQGTPSYLLLMYLFVEKENFQLEEIHLQKIIKTLVHFFVRRNLTDVPPTRDLTLMFMRIIENINGLIGADVVNNISRKLVEVSSDDTRFREALQGPIYQDNAWVTRFLLCALEERAMTRERQVNLWAVDGKQYVWTIEHIFPQGENIPQPWVEMIAEGNTEKAKELQQQHVHKLGNLTVSGFNSNLGNKSFEDKRDRTDKQGRFVGYKNGLYLNQELSTKTEWNIESIQERTVELVEELIEMFSLEENQ